MNLRCKKCNKLLARYIQCLDLEIKCSRCGTLNHVLQSDAPVSLAVMNNNQYIVPLPGSNPLSAVLSSD